MADQMSPFQLNMSLTFTRAQIAFNEMSIALLGMSQDTEKARFEQFQLKKRNDELRRKCEVWQYSLVGRGFDGLPINSKKRKKK